MEGKILFLLKAVEHPKGKPLLKKGVVSLWPDFPLIMKRFIIQPFYHTFLNLLTIFFSVFVSIFIAKFIVVIL